MKENFTRSNEETVSQKTVINATNIVERIHADALAGESPEDVHEALSSIGALEDFRRQTSKMPFASFHELVEGITNLNKLRLPPEEKDRQIKDWSVIMLERSQRFSPRVADLYQALIYAIRDEAYQPHFEEIRDKMAELKNDGDLEVLFAGEIPWDLKLNRIETRLVYDYLLGLRAFDKREGKEMSDDLREWREEQLKKAPTRPPRRRNESQPGVDPMERLKEGERAPAIWSIQPAWGGYYKEQAFHKWDSARNTWHEDEYTYSEVKIVPLSGNKDPKKGVIDIAMNAKIFAGQWISLPVPYTHDLHKIEAEGRDCQVMKDQNGDLVVLVKGGGEAIDIALALAPNPNKKFRSGDPSKITAPKMPSEFSEETITALEKISGEKRNNIERASAIRRYVLGRINYLAPKDRAEAEYYNDIYRTSPKGFAGAVDELKKGDCDVVNTYFAALCARLNIPVRHCVGHMVKGKDKDGVSSINVGTGHGWSEVWDEIKKEWVRMDATPAGDPNLEENDQQKDGGAVPGDYGEQEAIRPSDEQLEKLRQKLAEREEQLSYTKEEHQLAESAGVDLKEAREINNEIKEAESVRLPNSNELVVKVLGDLWDLLVESRKRELLIHSGPVRRSEGGENISDIIRHDIGVQAGETDPMSRERPVIEIKEEKLLSGMNVYIIADKSGSMKRKNSIGDEDLWKLQRRFEYMLFASIHRFNYNLKEAHLPADKNLDVRTMAISFRGENIEEDIDLDKPFSPRLTDKDKVKMWHSLGKLGSGNGDVTAIKYLYQEIKREKEAMVKQGIEDNRLRIVVAYSDGGYVGAEKQMRAWAEEMSKLGVVMVGIGLTESAASVPVVMHNPPKSFGVIVSNLEELTAATAKHIVFQATKLFPEKARQDAEKLIDEILYKFGITK